MARVLLKQVKMGAVLKASALGLWPHPIVNLLIMIFRCMQGYANVKLKSRKMYLKPP